MQYIINDVLCNPGGINKQVLCVRPLCVLENLGAYEYFIGTRGGTMSGTGTLRNNGSWSLPPVLDQCGHFCRTHSLHSLSDYCAV